MKTNKIWNNNLAHRWNHIFERPKSTIFITKVKVFISIWIKYIKHKHQQQHQWVSVRTNDNTKRYFLFVYLEWLKTRSDIKLISLLNHIVCPTICIYTMLYIYYLFACLCVSVLRIYELESVSGWTVLYESIAHLYMGMLFSSSENGM